MIPFDILATLLVVLALFDWIVAVILIRGASRYGWPVLVERSRAQVFIAITASVAAFLALGAAGWFLLPRGVPLLLLSLSLVAMSLPSILWLRDYLRGTFR